MNYNPYSPPTSQPLPPQPPRLRLFTSLAIGVHAFVFPWLALVFAIVNAIRLRRRGDVPLYGGLLIAMVSTSIFTIASQNRVVAIVLRVVATIVGLAVAWHQHGLVQPRLASDARPARWWLGWLVLVPLLFVFLVVWQFLSPPSVHRAH